MFIAVLNLFTIDVVLKSYPSIEKIRLCFHFNIYYKLKKKM